MILYGIKQCDTCRKASKWLDAAGAPCEFHDLRKDGVTAEQIDTWLSAIGQDRLINRRGTTWRQLSDEQKAIVEVGDETTIVQLLLDNPTLMKRPILEYQQDGEKQFNIGFAEDQYKTILATLGIT